MEEFEKKRGKKQLPIPANVSDRQEFFVGFGVEELKVVGAGVGIGFVIAILVYSITKEFVVPLFVVLIIAYGSYMLSYRNKYGENSIEKIKYFREFRKQQKLYLYEYVPLVEERKENNSEDNRNE